MTENIIKGTLADILKALSRSNVQTLNNDTYSGEKTIHLNDNIYLDEKLKIKDNNNSASIQFYNGTGVNTASIVNGNTTGSASFLEGFNNKTSEQNWGVQTGQFLTGMSDGSGGDIAFRKNCHKNGQVSLVLDGTILVLKDSGGNQRGRIGYGMPSNDALPDKNSIAFKEDGIFIENASNENGGLHIDGQKITFRTHNDEDNVLEIWDKDEERCIFSVDTNGVSIANGTKCVTGRVSGNTLYLIV